MDVLWEVAGWNGVALDWAACLAASRGWMQAGRRFPVIDLLRRFCKIRDYESNAKFS